MNSEFAPYNEEVLTALKAIEDAKRIVKMAEAYLLSLQEACSHFDPSSYTRGKKTITYCRVCGKELSNREVL